MTVVFDPQYAMLRILRGETFRATLEFDNDDGSDFPLTGLTFTAKIGGVSLSSGSGLTIDGTHGTIVVALTDTQTNGMDVGKTDWYVKCVDSGNVSFPLSGPCYVRNP